VLASTGCFYVIELQTDQGIVQVSTPFKIILGILAALVGLIVYNGIKAQSDDPDSSGQSTTSQTTALADSSRAIGNAGNASSNSTSELPSSESPVDVQVRVETQSIQMDDTGMLPPLITHPNRIYIVAKIDRVTIKNVVINRGNCSIVDYKNRLPAIMGYGQTWEIYTSSGCNVIEVSVDTDHGTWTANYQ